MQYNQNLSNYYKDIKEYRRLKDKSQLIKHEFNTTVTFLITNDKKGYGLTDSLV